MDERLERNWKMATAASENKTRPASKKYLENYDAIFRKNKKDAKPSGRRYNSAKDLLKGKK